MKAAKLYHTAITLLLDLSEADQESKKKLRKTIHFLRMRRLEALGSEILIPESTTSVRNPEFRKAHTPTFTQTDNA